jgi:SAM-dependent methyltransferase
MKLKSMFSAMSPGTQSEKTASQSHTPFVMHNSGYCYTCGKNVLFLSREEWLRDNYVCSNCQSIPRERALMYCIEKYYPQWQELVIHETSPINRGASKKLKRECKNYSASQFFPDFPAGSAHPSGFRNENISKMTFDDETFDLFISQDVMEHVYHPEKVFCEIARVLKTGGAHVFTVPLVNKKKPSQIRAIMDTNGKIAHFGEPEFHGNPVDELGSLVTMYWGFDITDFIFRYSKLYTTVVCIDNIDLGIRAEYIEVLISKKV